MIREMLCIECPNGCRLKIDDETREVSGNKCPRGQKYALAEITRPMRSVTSTVRTNSEETPVIPVRTRGAIPKNKMKEAILEIDKIVLDHPVNVGDVILPHFMGEEDCDLIATAVYKG